MTGQHVFGVGLLLSSAFFGYLSVSGYATGKVIIDGGKDGALKRSENPFFFRFVVFGYLLVSLGLLAFGLGAYFHVPSETGCNQRCEATIAGGDQSK